MRCDSCTGSRVFLSIADRVKVPRTTLQEHLNKAENKLLSSIIPQIQFYARKNRTK